MPLPCTNYFCRHFLSFFHLTIYHCSLLAVNEEKKKLLHTLRAAKESTFSTQYRTFSLAKGPTSPTHRLSSLGTEAVSSIETESIDTGPERIQWIVLRINFSFSRSWKQAKAPTTYLGVSRAAEYCTRTNKLHHFHKHSQPRFEKKKKHVGFNI